MNPIFTVGHSNHAMQPFLRLLLKNGITAVADVRSYPYSRLYPQFNREALKASLKEHRIGYVFLGRELGARSEDPACYHHGVVQYDLLARTPLFREGLERVIKGSSMHHVALLCAEKDPLTCHRTILVGRELVARGFQLRHIRENGEVEEHDTAMRRLLQESGLQSTDLFRSRFEVEQEALTLRASQIAYRRDEPAELASENK